MLGGLLGWVHSEYLKPQSPKQNFHLDPRILFSKLKKIICAKLICQDVFEHTIWDISRLIPTCLKDLNLGRKIVFVNSVNFAYSPLSG